MTLLDLQGMEFKEEGHGGSRLSVTGCPGRSSLSLLICN
jgi:Lanthionine-containing peptide SapB precursor RamS